ncbi:MAG: PIN domain-containing protein [Emticicia sp.]
MTKIVIDTNIIFSILRTGGVHKVKVLFDTFYEIYAPQFIMVELFHHKERIINNAKISELEVYELLDNVLQRIRFVNNDFISNQSYFRAFNYCKDVDEKDIPFVALAIELQCELWTNDDKLKIGLEAKGFNSFFNS